MQRDEWQFTYTGAQLAEACERIIERYKKSDRYPELKKLRGYHRAFLLEPERHFQLRIEDILYFEL